MNKKLWEPFIYAIHGLSHAILKPYEVDLNIVSIS